MITLLPAVICVPDVKKYPERLLHACIEDATFSVVFYNGLGTTVVGARS